MIVDIKSALTALNETFTLYCVFPSMILLGVYLTLRLRAIQLSQLKTSFSHLLSKKDSCEGNMSHFEAISTVLAGNFGTGNISGMAVAIATGGPGALVWMWVMAFFGAAIQYASCVLGIKYRTKNQKAEYVGGPMYYLSEGLGFKKLAGLFAVLTLFGAITVGNLAQVNSMMLPLESKGVPPLLLGSIMTAFVAVVLLGGMERMAKFASLVVPIKAFIYLGTTCIIICLNLDKVWPALLMMIKSSVDPYAMVGGVLGVGVYKMIATGFDRGIFATDAGTGIVPILQAGARTSNPIVDGLVTLVAPFMVMIVCTATGIVLLISGAWQQPDLQSTNMVTYAFREGLGSPVGEYIVIGALILFGYTTILAWAYCADRAIGYLQGGGNTAWFKCIYVAFIPLGALIQVDLVWTMADICITAMLMTNLIGIAGLSKEVISDSRIYLTRCANAH